MTIRAHERGAVDDRGGVTAAHVGVVGLGYVGLPLAAAFGAVLPTVAFDVQATRIEELQRGVDRNGEVLADALLAEDLSFTADPTELNACDFVIVAVPTPVDLARRPDLSFLESASDLVGRNLKPGAIVVFESTVFPGCTEDVCLPVLEKASGLKAGKDFFLGYSPERINPGDPEHTLSNIVKIVSAQDAASLDNVAATYQLVVEVGVHRAPDIRTAEAAKVIENVQRDLNIALVNEQAMLFHKMGLNMRDILEAAGTKWNFLPFKPGLVGGHCIPVDPYYLAYKAEELGYHPELILAGRRINDGMGAYVAQQTVKLLIRAGKAVRGTRALVLGVTFKEDVSDTRNSRSLDLVRELESYGVDVAVHDPLVPSERLRKAGLEPALDPFSEDGRYDAVVLTVAHRPFLERAAEDYAALLTNGGQDGVLVDVKGVLDFSQERWPEILYWNL